MFPDSRMLIPPVRLLLGLVLGAGALHARPAEEFPGLGEKWHYYRSPHFELYSGNDDYSSRKILEEMELMRVVMLENLKLKETLPRPVTIYSFASDRDFRDYIPSGTKKEDSLVCLWFNQTDRTSIVQAPVSDDDLARTMVFGEFVDYLFEITEQNPARWYRTGAVQVYSNMHVEPDSVVLGQPAAAWVDELRYASLFPWDQFFGLSEDSQTLQDQDKLKTYCAQAWLFLHYCRFGKETIPKDKLERFIRFAGDRKAQDNSDVIKQACLDILGCDYAELTKRLHHYLVAGDYRSERLARPKLEDARTFLRRDVPREEMVERLAELSLRTDRSPRGKLALLNALDLTPGDARLHETLGNDAYIDGDTIGVLAHWGKAVELGTDNPAIFHELGQIESRSSFETFDLYYRLPAARAAKLRNLLLRSIENAPAQSSGYEMLAWVESAAQTVDVAHVNLVQTHFSQVKDKASTLLALALVRLRMNDLAGARSMIDGLEKTARDEHSEKIGRTIRTEIERRQALVQTAEGTATPDPAPVAPEGK
jgi:hypothetical protein